MPVVEDLQKDRDEFPAGLFDLVHQDEGVRLPPDSLCELSSLIVSNIAWRSSDESGDRVLLCVFRGIDPDHRIGAVEHELGECSREARETKEVSVSEPLPNTGPSSSVLT